MSLATLKEKGQITVPANIRRQIQAHKGDIFNFEVVNGRVVMTPQMQAATQPRTKQRKGADIGKYIGSMKGKFGCVEEIDEYIRNERDSWD